MLHPADPVPFYLGGLCVSACFFVLVDVDRRRNINHTIAGAISFAHLLFSLEGCHLNLLDFLSGSLDSFARLDSVVGVGGRPDRQAGMSPPLKNPRRRAREETIAGHWQGTLDAGVKLRVVFNIEQAAEGKLTATLDSLDQGAKGIAIDEITFEDNTLRLAAKGIGGIFEGKRNAAGNEIAGTWKQGGGSLPLVLKPVDKPPVAQSSARAQKTLSLRRTGSDVSKQDGREQGGGHQAGRHAHAAPRGRFASQGPLPPPWC